MKYKVIPTVVALSLTIAVFTSCGAQNSVEESKDNFEIKLTQSDASDTSSVIETQSNTYDTSSVGDTQSDIPTPDDEEKLTLQMFVSLAKPDLQDTLACSELIISGEVIEAKEPYHTNPDGTVINSEGNKAIYAMATPYLVRVDEVYRGNVNPGDTVMVNTMNDKHLPLNAREEYNVITNIPNIYLDVGQKAVFCLIFCEDYFPDGTTVDDVGYSIASRYDGIFEAEPQNSEQAAAANAADQPGKLMHSVNFTINLDTLADEIEEAISNAAQYGVDENGKWIGYPNSAI